MASMLPIRYNFLKVTTNEEFPRLIHTKDLESGGGVFFRPFTRSRTVKMSLMTCGAYLKSAHVRDRTRPFR